MEEEPSLLKLVESANLQLSEIEMLESMFPDPSEFSVDKDLVKSLEEFAYESSDVLPSGLEYALNLTTIKGKVSMHAAIPSNYPTEPPDIYVRSKEMSRTEQSKINCKLNEYLESLESGDLVVGSVISWLQNNADLYLTEIKEAAQPQTELSVVDCEFTRAWIYSHHIYSKVKRKDIKDLSEEYNLTGFCLPGKPGIMCVEGLSKNVKDWWHTVRSWNWQKIVMKRLEENEEIDCNPNRFVGFQELGTSTNIRVKSNGYHVDMGDLYRYLEEHNSGYMFEEFFGVTGK